MTNHDFDDIELFNSDLLGKLTESVEFKSKLEEDERERILSESGVPKVYSPNGNAISLDTSFCSARLSRMANILFCS